MFCGQLNWTKKENICRPVKIVVMGWIRTRQSFTILQTLLLLCTGVDLALNISGGVYMDVTDAQCPFTFTSLLTDLRS